MSSIKCLTAVSFFKLCTGANPVHNHNFISIIVASKLLYCKVLVTILDKFLNLSYSVINSLKLA